MASVDKERDRRVFSGSIPDAPPSFLNFTNMETIAMIFFTAFALLVMVSGSVGIALLFRKFGDGWEFRRNANE